MRILLALILAAFAAGCAGAAAWSTIDPTLARAEALVARGDYGGALAAYDQFLGRYPTHTGVRTARDAVAQVLAMRQDVARLRDELTSRDRELGRMREELAAVRQELQARQAEAERLRGDLERLKQIDLKPERKRP